MRRALALVCLLGLIAVPAAEANAKPARVRIGRVAMTAPIDGRSALLVSVSYPIALVGHRLDLRVSLFTGAAELQRWVLRPLASGGLSRTPERRRRFSFVHRINLDRKLTTEVGRGPLFHAEASGALDVNGDGRPELESTDTATQALSPEMSGPPLCSTVPQLRAQPGRRLAIKLPACTATQRWKLTRRPLHGSARIRGDELIYRPAAGFRGTDSLRLSGGAPVVFRVGTEQKAVVRAIGDSVTAGFGYYDDGTLMGLTSLPECKPGSVTLVDACSSNSTTTSNTAKKVEYAPDYGLANNVSWAAQWSNEHGIANFENLAISGSEPVNWAPGGSLYDTTKQVESENPDYILMTLGANPLLSEILFGLDNMGCAIYADLFGKYEQCVEESFAEVQLRKYLASLYRDLVAKTTSTIFLMQYHLAIPSTALAYTAFQVAEMGKLLNREIASVAQEVNPTRLQVVTPPHFNVGIDISPVYPSTFSCSRLGYKVDGPSVQIAATQYELLAAHPLSFCEGPVSGPPWVISGDTGIHPSAAGYRQMASRVPAPE
jgi:lysophospholipase L1-like esterase